MYKIISTISILVSLTKLLIIVYDSVVCWILLLLLETFKLGKHLIMSDYNYFFTCPHLYGFSQLKILWDLSSNEHHH